MAEFVFDDAALPVSSDSPAALSEQVFGVYRQLSREREAAARQLEVARQEADGAHREFRRRLAALGAEVFHLRRCVATLREPMQEAGLAKEMNRLELLVKRFDEALEHNGVKVEALDGRELDDALAEVVEVLGNALAEVSRACVYETHEPLVTVDGQVLRFAKITSAVPQLRDA